MCWCLAVCTIDCAVGHVCRLYGEKNRDSFSRVNYNLFYYHLFI